MRRTRLLLGAAALVLGLTGPLAAVAHAQEGGGSGDTVEEVIHEAEANGATHADAECIKILADGGTIEECQAAPNPLLPETNEIIWGAIGFVIVFGFLAKVGYPQIKKGMDARTERIRADLEGAESAKVEAETVLNDYRAQLADAKAEAGRIIEEARQQADALKRDQEQRLQTELAAMREKAAADVESAKAQAITDLQNDVATIAIGAAEVVVQRNLDRDTQVQLVEQYIASLGARSN
jgi:F-type H+-transporting ATPase subunit b